MRTSAVALLVVGVLTLLVMSENIDAAAAELVYDFEHLTNGALHGQDGWVTVKTGAATDSQRHQVESAVAAGSAPLGYNGSRVVTYRYEGASVGGRASRVNDSNFSALTIRPAGVTVIEIEMERTYWGSSLRLGRDVNGNGDLENSEVQLGVRTRGEGTNKSSLQLLTGVTASTTTIGAYNRYQLAIDRTRERASLRFRDLTTSPIGGWTTLAGIQDLSTGFTTNGLSSDPTTWNAIGLQSEGNRGFFDNLKFRWLDVSTRSVDFGDRRDGTSGTSTVTVSGEYLTGALQAEIINDAASEFSFTDGSTVVPVVQHGTALDLRFTPLAMGDRTATLRIHGNDMATPLDINLSAKGPLYVDNDFDGGEWKLVAYGANGELSGPLTEGSGTYDPMTRSTSAVVSDALALVNDSEQMAITWADSGSPTAGLASYTEGLWFDLPTPAAMSLTGYTSGAPDGGFATVMARSIHGTWSGPTTMYLRADTFGVNYGDSYGLVGSLSLADPAVDWGPDAQDRAAVYLHPGRARQSGVELYARAYVTPSGTANGRVPSQMAIWVRTPRPPSAVAPSTPTTEVQPVLLESPKALPASLEVVAEVQLPRAGSPIIGLPIGAVALVLGGSLIAYVRRNRRLASLEPPCNN